MSIPHHEEIFQSYKDTFEEAVETENWTMARAVIADLQAEGFPEQAAVLEEALKEAQNHESN